MARLSYDSVEALIYDPVSANRTATRAALYSLGFRRTETVPTLEGMIDVIQRQTPDIVLAEAQGAACAFARAARAEGCAPVFLTAPFGPVHDVVPALVAEGWRLRGHRSAVAATALYRRAGVDGPVVARFSGTLAADEVLLWPADARQAGLLGRLGQVRLAWLSGWAADADSVARLGVDRAIPYSNLADHAALLAYAAATGAREIAAVDGFAQDLANALRDGGIADAYALGPPRQISLFD